VSCGLHTSDAARRRHRLRGVTYSIWHNAVVQAADLRCGERDCDVCRLDHLSKSQDTLEPDLGYPFAARTKPHLRALFPSVGYKGGWELASKVGNGARPDFQIQYVRSWRSCDDHRSRCYQEGFGFKCCQLPKTRISSRKPQTFAWERLADC
jgi:hypothetical protein